jgi:hypothetical protein
LSSGSTGFGFTATGSGAAASIRGLVEEPSSLSVAFFSPSNTAHHESRCTFAGAMITVPVTATSTLVTLPST